ncbi:hypothetical protein evm_012227 [Chilo suppressalis]|nr:hypothetical protein evm_012227 [Chilo suppressalis]
MCIKALLNHEKPLTDSVSLLRRMDVGEISDLLKAISNAISTPSQKDDDVALPLFNPDNDSGAAGWCDSIEILAKEFGWSSIKTATKAGRNAVQYPDIEIITTSSGSFLRRKSIDISNKVNMTTLSSDMTELTSKIYHLNPELQEQITQTFLKYPSVLDGSSTIRTGELSLRLHSNGILYYRPYRLAPVEKEKLDEIVNDLLNRNIIRESNSVFASPVLLVKKKDGSDRMCIDYRALSKLIEKDRFPLPLIEDQIDRLGKAKLFISIDMKNGFYQIPVSPESIKYTAFVTPNGHYEFLKMPFGSCNGPSVFQRAIAKAVQHLNFLLVYIDDILIPFTTIEEGLRYLEETLFALSKAGFTINQKKCKFFVDNIEYLGRHISQDGIRPSEAKTVALVHSPIPKNVKQVRQFMGLASYYRKFIPDFAVRIACITNLTKNNQKWEWSSQHDEARNYVIHHLSTKPLLSVFDPKMPTELYTDASSLGYGAILVQNQYKDKRVVAYFSKRTSPAESNYCSYDLETLAIFNALKHFRVYLLGIKFKIFTDCNSIKSAMNKKDISPRVARWWTFMQDFEFEIIYKKGKYIGHVDFLSRNPVKNSVLIMNCNTVTCAKKPRTLVVNLIEEPPTWLALSQQNDVKTRNLISQVISGDLDENQYFLHNDLLLYNYKPNEPKFYIPKAARLELLRLFHDENCHVGFEKTLKKLIEHFWFPRMVQFVKKYLRHCLICIQRKLHSGPKQGYLHPIEKTPVPFHTIHLDCTGPFTISAEGYRKLHIEQHIVATGTPRGNGQAERYVRTVIDMLNTICNGSSDWPSSLWRDNTIFEIGNIVFVNQDHRRHDKLSPTHKGPYEIIDILPFDRYSLRGINGLRNITVAKDKLRIWPGELADENDENN